MSIHLRICKHTDCDDNKAGVHPGAIEICDGIDNDCDGQIDEGVKTTYYRDADGDGYGDAAQTTQACAQPSGYVSNNTDCDDSKASVHPGALEICDGIDNDCNGQIDEGVKTTYYRDADGDDYGNPLLTTQACTAPTGYVTNNTDCNDGNASVYPGAVEVCGNGIDDNRNGQVDENCGGCQNATGLTTTNITSGSATLNWVASVNPVPASAVSISSVSVHEAINPTVKLYPNPSRGRFVVELHLAEKINGKATIQLMDMTDKTVYSENGTINNGVLRKNVSLSSSLAKGMYMARIIVNNKTNKAQLVYEK